MVTWKFNKYKADAEKVAIEIEQLENATPESILDYARNEDTELHKCFDWDDSIAAEKWRKQQARMIICNLVYVDDKKKEPSKLRVFYQSEEKEYKPVKFTLQKKDEYQELLERALKELHAFKEKYKMLTELDEIMKLID